MKMKIIILEDHSAEARQLIALLKSWGSLNNCELELTEYRSGEDYLLENGPAECNRINVFFLDIQLEGISGLDVARKLRRNGYTGPVIFLTAFREYVFQGYEVHAMNYLLKPVKQEPLFLCLDEIARDLKGNSYLYRSRQELIRIPYRDILTFSSSLHYVDILTSAGSFCQYTTLNSILNYLPGEFIRTHRSCIVNLAHIYKISGSTIVLSNHMTTQIGRSYMKQVVSAFADYSMRFD